MSHRDVGWDKRSAVPPETPGNLGLSEVQPQAEEALGHAALCPSHPPSCPSHPLEPKLVAFCCTYCAYTAGDLAGSMRLDYAPNVRVVKILCTGKIDAVLLLRAFEDGADGVYVAGCAKGDCHFLEGNLRAIQVVAYAKKLLAEIGVEPERLEFFHIPASAGPLFAARANEMTERVRKLGPNRLRAAAGQDAGGKLTNPVDEHPPLPPARFGRLIADPGGQTFLSVREEQPLPAVRGGDS